MKRQIIRIDPDLCTGCGDCIPNCPEGAIQIVDGKARLISDLFCDGLGACIGHCPEGAIRVEEREAEPYDERKVMENIIPQGENTVRAHLAHLKDHGEHEFYRQAIEALKEKRLPIPEGMEEPLQKTGPCACPGTKSVLFDSEGRSESTATRQPSRLTHWPVQMHLISPRAPQFRNADLVLAADCVAYAMGGFHESYLKGKALAIACPKLDEGQDIYLEKLIALIEEAGINTLTVMIMQVPCCGGLMTLAEKALDKASRKVPLKRVVVSVQGDILDEAWV